MTQWVVVQKIYSKIHPVMCTNTNHDAADSVDHRMAKGTKGGISWEWNITFLNTFWEVTVL